MIAVNLDQFHHDRSRLEDFDKDIQRRSDGESSRAHLAAHQHVEPKPAGLLRGDECDILRLTRRAVVHATRNRDIELARQVGELRVALAADDDAIQFVDDRRGVKQFVRRQAGQGAAVDIANVVDARLERAQVYAPKLLPDFRHGVERETAQLDLLPSGDVQDAIAKPSGELGDGAQLSAPYKAVGHANAHHEFAGRRFAEEQADPLQQFFFCGCERCRAPLDDLRQLIEDAQAVTVHRCLVAFDGVCANTRLVGLIRFHRPSDFFRTQVHACLRRFVGPCERQLRTEEFSLAGSSWRQAVSMTWKEPPNQEGEAFKPLPRNIRKCCHSPGSERQLKD